MPVLFYGFINQSDSIRLQVARDCFSYIGIHMTCIQCCASHAFTSVGKSVFYYVVITYCLCVHTTMMHPSQTSKLGNSLQNFVWLFLHEYGSLSWSASWMISLLKSWAQFVSETIVINQQYLFPHLCIHMHVFCVITNIAIYS